MDDSKGIEKITTFVDKYNRKIETYDAEKLRYLKVYGDESSYNIYKEYVEDKNKAK